MNTNNTVFKLATENGQHIKDGVTQLIIDRVKQDLDNLDAYLFDYYALLSDIENEVRENVKKQCVQKYTKEAASHIKSSI